MHGGVDVTTPTSTPPSSKSIEGRVRHAARSAVILQPELGTHLGIQQEEKELEMVIIWIRINGRRWKLLRMKKNAIGSGEEAGRQRRMGRCERRG